MKEAVKCPSSEPVEEWISMNSMYFDFFSFIRSNDLLTSLEQLSRSTIAPISALDLLVTFALQNLAKKCVQAQSNSTFVNVDERRYTYLWQDDNKYPKPTEVPACEV